MKGNVTTAERYHFFVALMLSGGFMGAYSYYLKGGVFANAETANLLILSMRIVQSDWHGALSVLVPIVTFFLGTILSEALSGKLGHRWPPVLLSSVTGLLAILAILPEGTPERLYHIAISLASSLEYDTFRQARGVPLSTLFCTAHIRGAGSSLYKSLHSKDREALVRTLYHFGMIATFIIGAMLCAFTSRALGTHTIALACLPLIYALVELARTRKEAATN